MKYYRWEYNYGGVGCPHWHRSPEAALHCGERLVRAARRAVAGKRERFYGVDLLANVGDDAWSHLAEYDWASGLRVGG